MFRNAVYTVYDGFAFIQNIIFTSHILLWYFTLNLILNEKKCIPSSFRNAVTQWAVVAESVVPELTPFLWQERS